jgi:N-acetylmuramoyl-L-alanine amidase
VITVLPIAFLGASSLYFVAEGASSAAAAQSSKQQVVNEPPQAPSLAGKVVAIDPGHNGANYRYPQVINRTVNAGNGVFKACDTTGTATDDGRLTEAAFNWDISNRVARYLKSSRIKVVMTRSNNSGVGPCITRRAAIGNAAHADLALSIHADGGPANGRGFHVIYPAPVRRSKNTILAPSKHYALILRNQLRAMGVPPANYIGRDGLDQRGDLGGLNLSTVPKVFVELGNMRNSRDAQLLKNVSYRERLAKALFESIEKYFRQR